MKKRLFLAAVQLSITPGKERFAKIWQDVGGGFSTFGSSTAGLGAYKIKEVEQKLIIGMANKNLFYYGANIEKIIVKPSDLIMIHTEFIRP